MKLYQWIKKIFKPLPKCEKCGSIDLRRGYYTRGWNNYCEQAAGDMGVMCEDCIHIKFDKSFDEFSKSCPTWVTPYKRKDE